MHETGRPAKLLQYNVLYAVLSLQKHFVAKISVFVQYPAVSTLKI